MTNNENNTLCVCSMFSTSNGKIRDFLILESAPGDLGTLNGGGPQCATFTEKIMSRKHDETLMKHVITRKHVRARVPSERDLVLCSMHRHA